MLIIPRKEKDNWSRRPNGSGKNNAYASGLWPIKLTQDMFLLKTKALDDIDFPPSVGGACSQKNRHFSAHMVVRNLEILCQ